MQSNWVFHEPLDRGEEVERKASLDDQKSLC